MDEHYLFAYWVLTTSRNYFLESDLFWVEGRGDGIISVNFEYFSHINYRLQTIWIKFSMGMDPTGSTESHLVLIPVISTWFECCQNHCTSCSKYLIVCCYCLFSHHETALLCTPPSSSHSDSLSCNHRRFCGQINCHPSVVAPCKRVAQFPYLAQTKCHPPS